MSAEFIDTTKEMRGYVHPHILHELSLHPPMTAVCTPPYTYIGMTKDYVGALSKIIQRTGAADISEEMQLFKLPNLVGPSAYVYPTYLNKFITQALKSMGVTFTRTAMPFFRPRNDDRGHLIHEHEQAAKDLELDDLQREALHSALTCGRGLIEAPCGSGKTDRLMAGLAMCAIRRRQRVLITVPAANLLFSTTEIMNKWLCDECNVYQLGGSVDHEKKVRQAVMDEEIFILVAVDKSLISRKDFRRHVLSEFPVLISDEVHTSGAPETMLPFMELLAGYRWGLSATLTRSDGARVFMNHCYGDKVASITTNETVETGRTVPIFVITFDMSKYKADLKASIDWTCKGNKKRAGMLARGVRGDDNQAVRTIMRQETQAHNDYRTRLLIHVGLAMYEAGLNKIVFVVEYLKHLDSIIDILRATFHKNLLKRPIPKVYEVSGQLSGKKQNGVIQAFRAEDQAILIGTNVFNYGVNIQDMDLLIMAGVKSTEVASIQTAGRVSRPVDGKHMGLVLDPDDCFVKPLLSRHEFRVKKYSQYGYTVVPANDLNQFSKALLERLGSQAKQLLPGDN